MSGGAVLGAFLGWCVALTLVWLWNVQNAAAGCLVAVVCTFVGYLIGRWRWR